MKPWWTSQFSFHCGELEKKKKERKKDHSCWQCGAACGSLPSFTCKGDGQADIWVRTVIFMGCDVCRWHCDVLWEREAGGGEISGGAGMSGKEGERRSAAWRRDTRCACAQEAGWKGEAAGGKIAQGWRGFKCFGSTVQRRRERGDREQKPSASRFGQADKSGSWGKRLLGKQFAKRQFCVGLKTTERKTAGRGSASGDSERHEWDSER